MSVDLRWQEFDLFELAQRCHEWAGKVRGVLEGPVQAEARALAGQGFVVPAGEVLAHAARVFGWVEAQPGHGSALDQTPIEARVQLIVDLVTQFNGLADSIELTWSSSWNELLRQSQDEMFVAASVCAAYLGSQREAVLARMARDWSNHADEERYRR